MPRADPKSGSGFPLLLYNWQRTPHHLLPCVPAEEREPNTRPLVHPPTHPNNKVYAEEQIMGARQHAVSL